VSGWRTIRIYVERPGKQSQNHKIRKEGRKDIVDVAFIPPAALFIQMKLFSLFNI
jgi:hypothetical protein